MHIVLLGAPGTGKGTQAQFISKEYNIPIISTGQILRNISKETTNLGKKINKIITNGKLVSDEIIIEIIKNHILQHKCKNGFILDGFPRTIVQAKYLKSIGIKIDYIFEFILPKNIILERIKQRKIDPKTGLTCKNLINFNKSSNNNPENTKKLQTRSDDRDEIVQKRLQEYEKNFVHLKKFYIKEFKNKNLEYYEINNLNEIKNINTKIKKIIKKYQNI